MKLDDLPRNARVIRPGDLGDTTVRGDPRAEEQVEANAQSFVKA